MRNAFASELNMLAESDPRIVLLSGDIGNRLFDPLKAAAPERVLNCGVAEANMMSVAAGMALNGLRPVVYTITPFVTTRCLEQIRVDVCYQNVPVVIVGVGAGLSYASLGATHHSCEDMALLRVLPNMSVVAPADAHEVRGALRASLQHDGPVYLRIGKKGEPNIHTELPSFQIGKAILVQSGQRVCFLANGTVTTVALHAADRLTADGQPVPAVYSFHTVKPLDTETLWRAFTEYDVVVTVEEHSVIGGLGSAVAEWLADVGPRRAALLRVGTPDAFVHRAGEQEQARAATNLTAEHIASRVRDRLTKRCAIAA